MARTVNRRKVAPRRSKTGPAPKYDSATVMTSMRLPVAWLAEVDRAAAAAGKSRTEFIVAAAERALRR